MKVVIVGGVADGSVSAWGIEPNQRSADGRSGG